MADRTKAIVLIALAGILITMLFLPLRADAHWRGFTRLEAKAFCQGVREADGINCRRAGQHIRFSYNYGGGAVVHRISFCSLRAIYYYDGERIGSARESVC